MCDNAPIQPAIEMPDNVMAIACSGCGGAVVVPAVDAEDYEGQRLYCVTCRLEAYGS